MVKEGREKYGTTGRARGDQQEAVPAVPGITPSVAGLWGSLRVLREGLGQPQGWGTRGTPGSGHSPSDKKVYKHCGTRHSPPKSHLLNVSPARTDGSAGQEPQGGGF